MNTIEERASKAWGDYEYREGCLYHTTFIDGYIQGAAEQKDIDDEFCAMQYEKGFADGQEVGEREMLDKACEWLINTYLGDYVTDEYGNGGIGDNVKLAEDLRKTMEEQK